MIKMVQPGYLPQGLSDRNKWLANFADKLGTYNPQLKLAPALLSEVRALSDNYDYLQRQLTAYARLWSKDLTALLEDADSDDTPQPLMYPAFTPPAAPSTTVPSGIFNRVVAIVNEEILPNDGLTPAIKTALGLDAPPAPPPGQVIIRDAVANPGGQVDLTLLRAGAPQIIVESRRGSEADFSLLDKVAAGHCLDNRPNSVPGQSEVREYRVRRSDGTQAVGNYSPIERVATQA